MKKNVLIALVFILCLTGCGSPGGSGLSSGKIKLTGRVADSETGNGLYAKVTISSGALSRETYTSVERGDDETLQDVGWFVFNDVPNGNIKIKIEVVKEDSDESVSLPLPKVVAVDDVDAKDVDYYGIWETTVSLNYDSSSIYEITDQYRFTGSKYNYIAMRPGYTAKVQVLASPSGEPVSGAKVFLSEYYYGNVIRSGNTDETGYVTFTKIMKHGASYGTSSGYDVYINVYPIDTNGDGCWDYVNNSYYNLLSGDKDLITSIVTMVPIDDLYGNPADFTFKAQAYSGNNFVVAGRPLYFTTNYPVTPRVPDDAICQKSDGSGYVDETSVSVESAFGGMGAKVIPETAFEAGYGYVCSSAEKSYFLYGTLDTVCPAGYSDVLNTSVTFMAVEESDSAFTAKSAVKCTEYGMVDGFPCIIGPITNVYVDGSQDDITAIDTDADNLFDHLAISCGSAFSGLSYNIVSKSLVDNSVLWEGNVACLDE